MAHGSNSEMVNLTIDQLQPWIVAARSIRTPNEVYSMELQQQKSAWYRASKALHQKDSESQSFDGEMEEILQSAAKIKTFEQNRDIFIQDREKVYQHQNGQHVETLLNSILGVIGNFAEFRCDNNGVVRASIRTEPFASHMFGDLAPITIPSFSHSPSSSHASTPRQNEDPRKINGNHTTGSLEEGGDDEHVVSEPRPIKRKASPQQDTKVVKKQRELIETTHKHTHNGDEEPSEKEEEEGPSEEAEEEVEEEEEGPSEDEEIRENMRTTRRSSRRTQGVTHPKVGEVYTVFHRSRSDWIPALLLPLGDFSSIGLEGDLEAVGLLEKLPSCYHFNPGTGAFRWRKGYGNNGSCVYDRKFPVILFDDDYFPGKCSVDWISVPDLMPFDAGECNEICQKRLANWRKWLRENGREQFIPRNIGMGEGEEEDGEREDGEREDGEEEEDDNEKPQPPVSTNIATVSETTASRNDSPLQVKQAPGNTSPTVSGSSQRQPVVITDDESSDLSSISEVSDDDDESRPNLVNVQNVPDEGPVPDIQQLATRAIVSREYREYRELALAMLMREKPTMEALLSRDSHGTPQTRTNLSGPNTLTPLQKAVEQGYDGIPSSTSDQSKIETPVPIPSYSRYSRPTPRSSTGSSSRQVEPTFALKEHYNDDLYSAD